MFILLQHLTTTTRNKVKKYSQTAAQLNALHGIYDFVHYYLSRLICLLTNVKRI